MTAKFVKRYSVTYANFHSLTCKESFLLIDKNLFESPTITSDKDQ